MGYFERGRRGLRQFKVINLCENLVVRNYNYLNENKHCLKPNRYYNIVFMTKKSGQS